MYKVLIVDDRDIFLLELKRLKLWGKASGFEIVGQANNGKQALALLNTNSYDLVFTDIRMPIVDGIQLLREIKNKNLCPCTVIMSEYSEFNYARQGIVLGAFDYIVKPANKEKITELLKRSKKYLDALSNKVNDEALMDSFEWAYPTIEDEKKIIQYFKNRNELAISFFKTTMENIYTAVGENTIKSDLIVKKMYNNIIKSVYTYFKWLNKYMDIDFFKTLDCIYDGNSDTFKSYYYGKVKYLFDFIKKFFPNSSDEVIDHICDYILDNFDEDLKLKVIAEKFYINNSYLSISFSSKAGIHFNDYVTMVKMARAEYLFKTTNKKIYEIGDELGYKDINYFSKLFKKYYGKTPSEYKNAEYLDYQI
jgi:two-component system response regulator YesN